MVPVVMNMTMQRSFLAAIMIICYIIIKGHGKNKKSVS
jgi:hypothetical protein